MSDSTRRTLRTIVQAVIALAVAAPVLVAETGMDASQLPWLVPVLAVLGVVARVANTPPVEAWLRRFLGGSLAATPATPGGDGP